MNGPLSRGIRSGGMYTTTTNLNHIIITTILIAIMVLLVRIHCCNGS